ncbi:transposase [Thalassomonas viridans]|uniref:Transposase n=1 Tax=Thalassomonas viridans TaxID=137584 RepID=A0AAE9Z961_9GAMM|nr:transposase [Thalassomonas viridans]WDE08846.1 transposase [Thalassomonas viridans]WDE09063.1 transposase [Thalassomonas viridans]WDE09071.1 transposase [Thalassomonas viridans]
MSNKFKRPKYSVEFKQDAVKLVTEQGYTQQEAADSLGISLSAIGRWVRTEQGYRSPSSGKQTNTNLAERAELEKLRKEVAKLKMERDILKKAAVFFAKENE